MATLERNVAPEDTTQSQWVGEAAIRGKNQVSLALITNTYFNRPHDLHC